MTLKVCRGQGKLRYPTHRLAIAALSDCVRQRLEGLVYRAERDIYLCPVCDDWHLTSTLREVNDRA